MLKRTSIGLILLLLISSCSTYKKNIMLQVETPTVSLENSASINSNYIIQANDVLELEVFTNKGERIIDPDLELTKEIGINQSNIKPSLNYLVNGDGSVKLPMVGVVDIVNKTLREAEIFLQNEYGKFYESPFVSLRYINKRVSVIGAVNKVVELSNENMKLIEVLALADAIDNNAIVQNIRLVRNEEVFVIDLSKSEDVQKTNMKVLPNDVIYIEPLRRPFIEAVKDYGPIISLVSSLTAIVVIISNSK